MTNEEKHDLTYGNPDWCDYWGIDLWPEEPEEVEEQ